jgi:hypothetical protein
MMDWIRFFEDQNIPYVSKGRNVKKGHVNIACPFCGPDDPSEHMGVSLTTDVYGCWRSAAHAGYKPWNLIRPLLNCSFAHARLVAQQYSTADPETVDEALAALVGQDNAEKRPPDRPRTLHLPTDFRLIRKEGTGQRFWHYLKERKFDQLRLLIREYELHYTTTGVWKDRIIFPIYQDGKLVSWTGRAIINPVDAPRYRLLGAEEGALMERNEIVYNADGAEESGGKILFVVEGPIDVLKIDFYGVGYGVTAVCPMGTRMSKEQASIIGSLSRRFKRTILLYDPGEIETVFLVMDMLDLYGVEVGEYPAFVKDDVGSLDCRDTERLIRSFL